MVNSNLAKLTKLTVLKKVFQFEELKSTNDRARSYLKRIRTPFAGPVLFTARHQTAGRGRGDHIWWSPEGSLFLTYAALRSDFGLPDDASVELSVRTASAAAETIRCFADQAGKKTSVRVKHPNDVLADGKKIAGILIESPVPEMVIIGIGVNLNLPKTPVPDELAGKLIFLETLCGTPLDPFEFVLKITKELFR